MPRPGYRFWWKESPVQHATASWTAFGATDKVDSMNGSNQDEKTAPTVDDMLKRARLASRTMTIAAAVMATAISYVFMTQFFTDVVGLPTWQAMAFGGFLELCLLAAGLQARERILADTDAGVLITLTWIFSGTSAVLSASHEVVHRGVDGAPVLDLTAGTPLTLTVRAVAPLTAAVMWHLLLIGEKHMVSGKPRDHRKQRRLDTLYRHLVHVYLLARERHRDLSAMNAEPDTVEAARLDMVAARAEMYRQVPVETIRSLLAARIDVMAADFEGSARVDRMSEIRKAPAPRKALPRTEGGARLRAVPSATPREVSTSTVKPDTSPTPQVSTDASDTDTLDVEARDLRICALYKEQVPVARIARDVEVSRPTVYAVLDRYGLRDTNADT
jgi:hypothetical protein